MRKVIIDCDPGIDDAFALAHMALDDSVEIVGLCSVHGNSYLKNTTKNLKFAAKQMSLDVPIGLGSADPIIGKAEDTDWHGENGFGGLEAVTDDYFEGEYDYAWDMMYDLVSQAPGEISVVALGPVTNLALTMKKYPDFVELVKDIWIMGGTTLVGNALPNSEYNFYSDPFAAKIVLESSAKCHIIGLNATEQTGMNEEELDGLVDAYAAHFPFLKEMVKHYKHMYDISGFDHYIIHDLAATYAFAQRDAVEFSNPPVDVAVTQGPHYGRLLVDRRPYSDNPQTQYVAEKMDAQKFYDYILQVAH